MYMYIHVHVLVYIHTCVKVYTHFHLHRKMISAQVHHHGLWRSGCWSANATQIFNRAQILNRMSTGPLLLSLIQTWRKLLPSLHSNDKLLETFQQAVVPDQVMRQAGQDPQQVQFRDILLRLRDAKVTVADWNCLMIQTPTRVQDLTPFTTALHLIPTVEAVVEHNVAQLHASGQPIATIKAVHT